MIYKVLADMTVLVHLLWILFLIFGAGWGVRNRKVKDVHIAGLAFAVVIQIFNWYCPLTHLEAWLRSKHDPRVSYTGSFITHYMEKIVYIELPPSVIFGASIALCAITSWIYLKRGMKA